MANLIKAQDGKLTLTGFEGMTDFTIGATVKQIVIFPKLLAKDIERVLLPGGVINEENSKEAIYFLKTQCGLETEDFTLSFHKDPATGNYTCSKGR